MARPTGSMIRSYADDLRLFPTAAKRVRLVVLHRALSARAVPDQRHVGERPLPRRGRRDRRHRAQPAHRVHGSAVAGNGRVHRPGRLHRRLLRRRAVRRRHRVRPQPVRVHARSPSSPAGRSASSSAFQPSVCAGTISSSSRSGWCSSPSTSGRSGPRSPAATRAAHAGQGRLVARVLVDRLPETHGARQGAGVQARPHVPGMGLRRSSRPCW